MDNVDVYAQQMQKMYMDAFEAAEKMKEAALTDRNEAADALVAINDLKKEAERNGEQMALEYFSKRRQQLIDQTREETLSAIVLEHLKNNKNDEEIMEWLDVEEDFIADCKKLLRKQKWMKDDPKIHYYQSGRGGTITYIAGRIKINFDWEFGGGNAVALIFIPEEKYWEAQTGTSLSERDEILKFIGQQVVEDQAPNGSYRITNNSIDILH